MPLFSVNYATIRVELWLYTLRTLIPQFMVNFYDKNRFISKSELAKLAGVSYSTFKRYLHTRQHILSQMRITPKTQKLPPQAVHYICEDYCIDLPLELQNQEVLNKSPIYQQFIRHLQDAEFYKLQLKYGAPDTQGIADKEIATMLR